MQKNGFEVLQGETNMAIDVDGAPLYPPTRVLLGPGPSELYP